MPRLVIAVLTAALLAALLVTATPAPARADSVADTVIIEMRVWQRTDNLEDVWVSARPEGGRWDTLGTIPLPRSGLAGGYAVISQYRYGDLAVGGVELRVWQSEFERQRIYVQVCGACPEPGGLWRLPWRPLGKTPLPLDDGHSPSGRYRYGDIDVAVPRGNPGLVADREHLLALRDVLAGGGAELDWDVGTPTTSWEGVTVARTPPRVSALRLVDRGLTGEIWGYLGDLTELRVLRLNGNALRGTVPSKLSLLTKLRWLYLSDNDLEGCVPPLLRTVRYNDLGSLGLPDCPAPAPFFALYTGAYDGSTTLPTGTYALPLGSRLVALFDVLPERSVRVDDWGATSISDLAEGFDNIFDANDGGHESGFFLWLGDDEVWLYLDRRTGVEVERSHYSPCIYPCGPWNSKATAIERLAASVWVHTSTGDDGEWVWP